MEQSGRSVGQDYKFSFNGKLDDNEFANGIQDFGARMYDEKLGRWMSTDPHQGAYSSISPYSAFYNNPNLFIDGDGRDNIIYIVNFSAGRPDIDIPKAAEQLQLAIDGIMGTDKVKVVVLRPDEWDKTKLDNTDAVIAYGSIANVKDFAGDKLDYQLYLPPGQGFHEVASGDGNNLSGIIDSKLKDFDGNENFVSNKEAYLRPGNSAQDWLVLTMLHTVGHQVFGKLGHTTTELDLQFLKTGHKYECDTNNMNIYKHNFMLDGNGILDAVSRYNPTDKNNKVFPNDVKTGLDYLTTSFKSFTFLTSNKFLFQNSFKNNLFKASKPNAKMKTGSSHTTYIQKNKPAFQRAKY